jgi:hypothetical protein
MAWSHLYIWIIYGRSLKSVDGCLVCEIAVPVLVAVQQANDAKERKERKEERRGI